MSERDNDLLFHEARQPRPTLRRTLAPGLRGHDITRLQAELRRAGATPGTIDGVFGDRTATAVREFATRRGLAAPNDSVDQSLWLEILRASAQAHADALEALARGHEQAGSNLNSAATAFQTTAAALRSNGNHLAAANEEEQAAAAFVRAAQRWQLAAEPWLRAATVLAEPPDPEGRDYRAHARHLQALDHARSNAVRAINTLSIAGKDFTTAGNTDHHDRLAAAALHARNIALD